MNFGDISGVNSFQAFVIWFFCIIGALILKFLHWAMPKTFVILFNYFKSVLTEDLSKKIDDLSFRVKEYKSEKHRIENENKIFLQAILDKDDNVLEIIREKYSGKK
jgi:hypothetical protein